MNPGQLLPIVRRKPDEIVLFCVGSPPLSVGQALESADRLATSIRAIWPNWNHSPCLILDSSKPIDFVIGLLACRRASAVAACWSRDSLTLDEICNLVGAEGVVTNACSGTIELLSGYRWLERHPGNLIVTTSGSTGAPKGVSLNFESVSMNAALAGGSINLGAGGCAAWAIDLDFGLMSALNHFLMAWNFGLPIYQLKGNSERELRTLFTRTRVGFGGAPLQLKRLAEILDSRAAPAVVVSSGDFLVPRISHLLYEMFPNCSVNSFYGLTEVSGRFCVLPDRELRHNPSVTGQPLPGFDVRIGDPSDGSAGTEGELEIRTPLLFNGYYKQGSNYEAHPRGEWFPTGDVGEIVDGYVRLSGRNDDVFKVSGIKVDRFTIERHLADVMGGVEYCVLPVEHELIGQCPALFIGQTNKDMCPLWVDIIRHLKKELPSRYLPMYGYRLDSLPRLANGKLDKRRMIGERDSYEKIR